MKKVYIDTQMKSSGELQRKGEVNVGKTHCRSPYSCERTHLS